jgi:hypothetical protein
MQFIQDNEWYKAVRITGPSHNLLGLAFDAEVSSQVAVEVLPTSAHEVARIAGEDVLENVLQGIIEANRELGTQYQVSKIQFVPTDTPPVEIYRQLAKSIVETLASKQGSAKFKRVGASVRVP